jgi:hypothetical protein
LKDVLDYEQPNEDVTFVSDFLENDSELVFYSYREMCAKVPISDNRKWVAIPMSSLNSDTSHFIGIQYQLNTNVSGVNNCDISIFKDDIINLANLRGSVAMELIKKGEVSERVKIVQTLLNIMLNISLSIDGEFGNNTYYAVVSYQRVKGLDADGVIGVNTAGALLDDLKYNIFKFVK